MGTHNDRGRGILNGQRGTVRAVDRDHQALKVELDSGRQITLDSGYLSERRLDHAYALTAHKAQGATVARTFVLGSQDLYRELGYTALSRHRDETRFYVARGDLDKPEHDIPTPDPVVSGLERLLKRSGAKQLALESLKDRDTPELKNDRHELRKPFEGSELPSAAHVEQLGWERDRANEALERTDRRIERLQALRDQTGLLAFRERGRIDNQIADAKEIREQQLDRCDFTTASHDLAARNFHDWLGKHGDQAAQLVATGRELAERQQLDHLAVARQEAVARTPNWPERELPTPDSAMTSESTAAGDGHPTLARRHRVRTVGPT